MAIKKANSTHITASGLIHTGYGGVMAVILTGGSDAASVTLYDNTAASGTVIAVLKAGIDTTVVFTPAVALGVAKGIYAAITGTTPDVTVAYIP